MTTTVKTDLIPHKFLMCIFLIYIFVPIYTGSADISNELISKVQVDIFGETCH